MYLQISHAAADLAAPAIPLQNLLVQFAVGFVIEPNSRAFPAWVLHEGSTLIWAKNVPC